MKTMFLLDGRSKIKPIEVVRSTDLSVFLSDRNGSVRRSARFSDYFSYYDTWEIAHAHLIKRVERKVLAEKSAVIRAEKELAEVLAMKPDEQS